MPKHQDIVIHFDDFIKEHKNLLDVLKNPTPGKLKAEYQEQAKELKEKTGGLKGVSPASGFIQRAMAEMKNNKGYKKGSAEISKLNLKDGAKFDPKKVKKSSAFISRHLVAGVPWEQRRRVPIITTGQTARVREVDGKVINFDRTDPQYNKSTLSLYPLPRANAKPPTEAEKKQMEAYRKAYTELLKKQKPSDFVERPNQPPKEVAPMIKRKPGRPPKPASEMIGKRRKKPALKVQVPETRTGLPPRLDRLVSPNEMTNPLKGEIAERKYSLLTEAERNLPDDEALAIANAKLAEWRRINKRAY